MPMVSLGLAIRFAGIMYSGVVTAFPLLAPCGSHALQVLALYYECKGRTELRLCVIRV